MRTSMSISCTYPTHDRYVWQIACEVQQEPITTSPRCVFRDTLGSVSVGGVARFHEMFRPLLFDVVRLPAPDMYRLPPGVGLTMLGKGLHGERFKIYAGADIYVSASDFEYGPIAALEAMARAQARLTTAELK